ncbi:MAG: acyl-ACP--UDP-N-acetylglucosamine O-acyltransferase [Verrucomicrobia subdivision 3 bacterium]|nr:acyl-ACP--UDP-N-acetylglucosamine O-acyltransferase [Limisphaerales bacterium]
MIHPTAIIDPKAELHETVSVGPYTVIDSGVTVGADCVIGPHIHLTGEITLGKNNRIHAGAVLGDAPQDLKYTGEPTRLRIGDDNVIREHVTLHRSNSPEEDTIIGSHNFFMAASHVGHNAVVGDHNIFANGALVGGHAVIADRVFLSGNCAVHQFVRIGTLAMMQGNAAVSQDLPPYTMGFGVNKLCGLNIVGLRRAGVGAQERSMLKACYRRVFLEGEKAAELLKETVGPQAGDFLEFIVASDRGVCAHASRKASVSD